VPESLGSNPTLAGALSLLTSALHACGLSQPASQAEALLCEALKISWSDLKLNPTKALQDSEIETLQNYLVRRCKGEPLAYIAERAWFFEREFYVDSRVLIPRPETEILVEKALIEIPEDQTQKIVDLGCGSGCIGLTLARLRPQAVVTLVDKSAEALQVAKANQSKLQVDSEVLWVQSEVQETTSLLGSPFDIVVANPPYIPEGDLRLEDQVKNYEPFMALYSENQGLECIHKWLQWSYHNLREGGFGFFEFGEGQDPEVLKFVNELGLAHEATFEDYQQIPRVLKFRKV